jgi:hypothetical protein
MPAVRLDRGFRSASRWRDFQREQLLRALRDLDNHKYFRPVAEKDGDVANHHILDMPKIAGQLRRSYVEIMP